MRCNKYFISPIILPIFLFVVILYNLQSWALFSTLNLDFQFRKFSQLQRPPVIFCTYNYLITFLSRKRNVIKNWSYIMAKMHLSDLPDLFRNIILRIIMCKLEKIQLRFWSPVHKNFVTIFRENLHVSTWN